MNNYNELISQYNRFVECESCRAKPGSPLLCSGCLQNRQTISDLSHQLARMISTMRMISEETAR